METLIALKNKLVANFRYYAIIALILVMALFGYKSCVKIQKKQDSDAKNTVLTPDQKEKVVVDPGNHTIDIIKKNPDGTTTTTHTYLPDRPTDIVEDNNGKINVVSHKFGVEHRPYVGVGGSLDATGRVHAGMDLWYYKKLDLGTGVSFNTNVFRELSAFNDTRLDINASYNFYSNTSIAVSVDNHRTVGVFLKVRL